MLSRVPDSNTLIAYAIVASHGIEATRKTHFLQQGRSLEDCIRLGYDLLKVWTSAANEAPPIHESVPEWLQALHWGYAKPCAFRYLPDMYGVGAPRADELIAPWERVLASLYRTSSRL